MTRKRAPTPWARDEDPTPSPAFPVATFWESVNRDYRASTPLQAMMQTPPGEEVRESSIESREQELERAVSGVLAQFSAQERDMLIWSLHTEMSVRDIARQVGVSKSDVHRKLPKLKVRLRELMLSSPEISRYVGVSSGDDDPDVTRPRGHDRA